MKIRLALSVVPLALAAVACRAFAPEDGPGSPADRARGAALYAEHCAVCHGAAGDGDGLAASFVYPPPRRFSSGRFRLMSSNGGAPSELDLLATLERGLPGTAMPAWGWLGEDSLRSLAGQVRLLATQGAERRLSGAALAAGRPLDSDECERRAAESTREGQRFVPPHRVQPTAATIARGRELYRAHCTSCHGDDGRGRGLEPQWNEDKSLNWARDFTSGVLKGGASFEALAARIALGMPGSSMQALALAPSDLAALTTYTASLIPPGSEARYVHRSETLRVARVKVDLPRHATDALWSEATELDIVLAPLVWRDDAVMNAKLAALHDGRRIALRLRWSDSTRDDGGALDTPNRDGAALAFSNEAAPPLFGMGSQAHPVNLWHWKAERPVDAKGVLDLVRATPHLLHDPVMGESRIDVTPLYLPAPSGAVAAGAPTELTAEGFATLRELETIGRVVACSARYSDGGWSLVFLRDLAPRAEREVDFSAKRVRLACAIWDGNRGDHGASKSISIWQRVDLE